VTIATGLTSGARTATAIADAPYAQPIPWRTLLREAAGLWLAWQAIVIAFTYTSLTFAIANSQRSVPAYTVTPSSFYEAWVRFDGNWYAQIAATGYSAVPGLKDTLAFFPLYPLLIRLVSIPLLGNIHLAAVLIARLADFSVCLGILALAWQELGANRALGRLALAITLAFPMAFFLSAAYTESLFLAEVCFTLLFLRRRTWGLAALFAFLAALTHPRGLVLFLPLAWEWMRVERPWEHFRDLRVLRNGVLVLGAIPLGFLIVAVVDMITTGGDPLAIIHSHASFGRVTLAPWLLVRLIFGIFYRSAPGTLNQAYNLADIGLVLVVTAVLIVAVVRGRMPVAFVLYSVGLIVLAIASPTPNGTDAFLSAGRFVVPSVPVFLALAAWAKDRPWLAWLIIGGGLCLETTLAAFFLNGGFLI
jgi:hypothetical protein